MKFIACYKSVPFEESIGKNPDRTLNFSNITWEIGQYDLNAVEAACQLATASEGSAAVLTVNGEVVSNSKLKKGILSRGPSEMFGVQDASLEGADTYTVASVLKAAIEKIGDVDVVLCGEGSGDMYAQQVGNVLGGLMGWTTVNAVSSVKFENGVIHMERSVDDGVEVIEASAPLVISVTGDVNRPRIPTMKDIMGAGKKPATVWTLEDVTAPAAPTTEIVSVLAPEETGRQQIIFPDASAENLDKFFDALKLSL